MDHIGYLLSDRARLMRRAFDERTRSMGLTGPQARLLLYLARNEGQQQAHYAEVLDVEPITLTRMIDRRAEAGLVERRADPADRRARRLHLTAKSAAMVTGLRGLVETMTEQMLAGIAAADRDRLSHLLVAIGENLAAMRETVSTADG